MQQPAVGVAALDDAEADRQVQVDAAVYARIQEAAEEIAKEKAEAMQEDSTLAGQHDSPDPGMVYFS